MKRKVIVVVLVALLVAVSVSHAQNWKQVGPAPMDGSRYSSLSNATLSGIVTDIAIDPSGATDSTIYVASGAGGVWKTTNGGSSWSSLSDSMAILFMGAVSLDPSNASVVYAGVGGPYCCFLGGGIYRSTDAGGHWTLLNPNGIFSGAQINRIVLPKSGTLLVATNQGLFKSTDSGKSFGNNDPKFDNGNPIAIAGTSSGSISDLKLDTVTATTVYVAVHNEGLFKSTDSGSTFPATGTLINSESFPASIVGDVWITFAQSTRPNNKTIYALLCPGSNANACVVQKSTTRGVSFTSISPIGSVISVNQGDYDQITGVDPQDANKVYIGLRQIYYSTDGGRSGFGISNEIDTVGPSRQNLSHTDDHAIAFSPASHFTGPPTRVYFGSDGGLASTAAKGSSPGSQWQFLNKGLATALLYDMDFGRGNKANNAHIYGALQDNGTSVATPGHSWSFQCCGDSGAVAVDPANPLHAITENDGCLNNTTNGHDWSGCTGAFPKNVAALGLLRFDPNGGIAYATAATELFQSTDNGGTFSLIHTFPNNITAIDQVKGDKNVIWVGLSDGTVSRTHTAQKGSNSEWSNLTVDGSPSGQSVNGIAIDPTDTSTVVVVYPGFSDAADPPKHVFLTTDDGVKWQNIGGTVNGGDSNIPDLPLFSVVIAPATSPHTIIVGSDVGVLQTADQGKTWAVLGQGFPKVQVTRLVLDYTAKPPVLRASTFGRSVFELEEPCPTCPSPAQCKQSGCVGPASWGFGLSCTGSNVGIVYNGECVSISGEPVSCYAGFNGSSSATASWGGLPGPPLFLNSSQQDTAQVCTQNLAGEENCKTVTLKVPACPSGPSSSGPPPLCGDGQHHCDNPPRCIPTSETCGLLTPAHP